DTYWGYDTDNFVYQKTYHDGTGETYRYSLFLDALDSTTDANGRTTRYTYDADLNPTGITYNTTLPTYPYPFSTYPTSWNVSYHYNTLNQLDTMTDDVGTTTYGYDILGRTTTIDGPWANDTLTYHYDNLGRCDWRQINGTDQNSYHFDSLSRLDSLISPAGTFGFSYVGNTSLLSQRIMPNGTRTNYVRDTQDRLQSVQNVRSDGSNISHYSYGYDDANHQGHRAWQEQQVGTNPLQHIDYGYDMVNQLTGELSTESPMPQVNNSYSYDSMGNRTAANWSGTQSTYTPNALNQYTSIATTNGGNTSSLNLNYDYNGNLTSQGNTTYVYDDVDRLAQIIFTDAQTGVYTHKSEFVYDGNDLKRLTREYSWDAQNMVWQMQSEIRYVYDGANVVQERDSNNQTIASYTNVDDIGGLLARSTAEGHFYYHYDGATNVGQLTDVNQNIVANYGYDAFGNTSVSSGSQFTQAGQPYRYSTKEYHSYSGLYDYGLRFYSPGMGRWISQDPLGEEGGLNLYAFVANDPTNLLDPDGLDWLDNASNFSAGWGDTLTLGGTKIIRVGAGDLAGVGDANAAVNYGSGWYKGGEWAGTAHSIAFGAVGGLEAAGAKGAGKEFSHWIPNRFLKRTGNRWIQRNFGLSKWNGNYVSPARHYMHDPFRFPRGWKQLGDRFHPILQQLDRVPRVYYGIGAGAAWGLGHQHYGKECP
ncbi:MAG: RHS repeat-associated core domain-containing protein, partial [Abitibacteriaceae bacterium]|nr:RHS repeat-associated core domain-containing protein [Abditibacteriaceae bacterium]